MPTTVSHAALTLLILILLNVARPAAADDSTPSPSPTCKTLTAHYGSNLHLAQMIDSCYCGEQRTWNYIYADKNTASCITDCLANDLPNTCSLSSYRAQIPIRMATCCSQCNGALRSTRYAIELNPVDACLEKPAPSATPTPSCLATIKTSWRGAYGGYRLASMSCKCGGSTKDHLSLVIDAVPTLEDCMAECIMHHNLGACPPHGTSGFRQYFSDCCEECGAGLRRTTAGSYSVDACANLDTLQPPITTGSCIGTVEELPLSRISAELRRVETRCLCPKGKNGGVSRLSLDSSLADCVLSCLHNTVRGTECETGSSPFTEDTISCCESCAGKRLWTENERISEYVCYKTDSLPSPTPTPTCQTRFVLSPSSSTPYPFKFVHQCKCGQNGLGIAWLLDFNALDCVKDCMSRTVNTPCSISGHRDVSEEQWGKCCDECDGTVAKMKLGHFAYDGCTGPVAPLECEACRQSVEKVKKGKNRYNVTVSCKCNKTSVYHLEVPVWKKLATCMFNVLSSNEGEKCEEGRLEVLLNSQKSKAKQACTSCKGKVRTKKGVVNCVKK